MPANKNRSAKPRRAPLRLRLAVVAALVFYPAGAALKLAYPHDALSAPALTGAVLVAMGVIGWVTVLASSCYRTTFAGAPDLDEREIAERADAFQNAYIGGG